MVVPGGVFVLRVEVVADGVDVGEGIGNGWIFLISSKSMHGRVEMVSAFGSAAE